MEEFELLLAKEQTSVERFVRFRINSKADADDVLQEIYITAYEKFSSLKSKDSFKAWLISIARNKCNDYFRGKAALSEITIDDLTEKLSTGRCGISESYTVSDTMNLLGHKDKQILYLYFWKDMPQSEIAKLLGIPVGTVKSRLHTAKQNFKAKYPYHTEMTEGYISMKKLPEFIPEYTITESCDAPFSVKWEELMGWFLVPRLGEKITFGSYDMPSRKMTEINELEVVGKAKIHGIEGVEISVKQNPEQTGEYDSPTAFVAQLTETHCRYLATVWDGKDGKEINTFLDGDVFISNWGYGEDNIGNETNLTPKSNITRSGAVVTTLDKPFLLDIVGRYTVTIGKNKYDTVCVMDIQSSGIVSEQFLDKNGRTVLWRRFNRDDWAIDRYKKPWSEQLPENDKLIINGTTYVEWYDCITEYVL